MLRPQTFQLHVLVVVSLAGDESPRLALLFMIFVALNLVAFLYPSAALTYFRKWLH